jgi:hypothetical protein
MVLRRVDSSETIFFNCELVRSESVAKLHIFFIFFFNVLISYEECHLDLILNFDEYFSERKHFFVEK